MIQGHDEIICYIYSSYRNQQKLNKVRLKEGDKELERQIERERKREDEREIYVWVKKRKVIKQMPVSSFKKDLKEIRVGVIFMLYFLAIKDIIGLFCFYLKFSKWEKYPYSGLYGISEYYRYPCNGLSEYYRYPCKILLNYIVYAI